MKVQTGLDVWVDSGFSALRGKRVGAIVNPTSVDARFRHLADLLGNAPGVTLACLFGPEHGVRGQAQYMEAVGDVPRDRRTGVPVHSLYGSSFSSLSPRREWVQGLDALVFDIQDVGSRYYTYVYTMALAMKVAAQARVPFYVLDRPNPINGVQMEGNLIEKGFHSFVGLYSMPNRHGMTVGELARLFNEQENLRCELHVVPMEGWRRDMHFSDTGLAFVPPSPNMPTADTALVYPGMCLLEGTNVSEGRGTCRPFEQFGAPWLQAEELVDRLHALKLPGVCFRPVAFTPTFDKYRGQSCEGAMMHVMDPASFRPFLTGLGIVKTALEAGGPAFAWRADAYEFVEDIPAFDLLAGCAHVRTGLEQGQSLPELTRGFEAQLLSFKELRKKYLLYPEC